MKLKHALEIGAGLGALGLVGIAVYEKMKGSSSSMGGTPPPAPEYISATSPAVPISNANATQAVTAALVLARAGHGQGKEGDVWVQKAIALGANSTQMAQLRSAGYAV
jgi:hypothetical protein